MLNDKQGGIKYHFFFWVFGMTQPRIEPRFPGPLVNTLTIMPMSGDLTVQIKYDYFYLLIETI